MQISTNQKIKVLTKQIFSAGSPYNIAALLISVLTISIVFTACGSDDLARSEAQTQIEKTNEFKSLFTLNLITSTEAGQKRNGGGSAAEVKSADETTLGSHQKTHG